ncbi:hypothetical protein BDZ91DRAFT_209168 [Kalaharituber pfeilii]|nr:hypothetical protein BDZ91DRAFT_209168 [Kalaharituber pfeilii]
MHAKCQAALSLNLVSFILLLSYLLLAHAHCSQLTIFHDYSQVSQWPHTQITPWNEKADGYWHHKIHCNLNPELGLSTYNLGPYTFRDRHLSFFLVTLIGGSGNASGESAAPLEAGPGQRRVCPKKEFNFIIPPYIEQGFVSKRVQGNVHLSFTFENSSFVLISIFLSSRPFPFPFFSIYIFHLSCFCIFLF